MWKSLPHNSQYAEFHPCLHRWMQQNISNLPPKYVRHILKPISKRTEYLALPYLRRLLTLYTLHSEILPPDKKDKILQILLDNGITEEQLNTMILKEKRLKEIKRMKAEAGPFDVFDDEGNIITGKEKRKKVKKTKNKKKKKEIEKKLKKKSKKKKLKKSNESKKKSHGSKKKLNKSKKQKRNKAKDGNEEGDEYIGFKSGKSGQLGPGWPHHIGLQLMTLIWKLGETPPDEVFISRAPAYFNVQAEALHTIFGQQKEPQITDVNTYLNIIVWIAQNVIAPAQTIPDENVEKLLQLRGGQLVIKKNKKKPQKKKDKEEKKDVYIDTPKRKWTEQAYPKSNPEKRKIRTSTLPELSPVQSQSSLKSFLANEAAFPENHRESIDISKGSFPLHIDEESIILNSSIWYDPYNPEFIYDGPHIKPKNINFVNDNEEFKWILTDANMNPQPAHPNPVPIFFPELRPLIHSGVTTPILSENDCWFIMSNLEFYNTENSKNIDTASVKEQLKLICRLIKTIAHSPKMNLARLLELIAELCESIELSENDETITPMEQIIDEKRITVLEKLFLKAFGSKFRDYNEDTPNYMRIICQRGAVLIRHLYEHTAGELWKQQKHEEVKIIEEIEKEEIPQDDPEDILKWEEWLQFLSKASNVATFWQKWLQNEIESEELPDNKDILIQETKEWIFKGETIGREAQQFLDGVKFLKPIYHRPNLNKSQENIDSIDNSEDAWSSEEDA